MSMAIAERGSDVPLVQTIWRAESERASTFSSVAVSRWEFVVTKLEGRTTLSVRGPETTFSADDGRKIRTSQPAPVSVG